MPRYTVSTFIGVREMSYAIIDNVTDEVLEEFSSEPAALRRLDEMMGLVSVTAFDCPTYRADG